MNDSKRKRITSGSTFEAKWGYSRAVVDGPDIFVSGTTGFDYTTMTVSPDLREQTRRAFDNISAALREAGSSLDDVVRVRYYVTDAALFETVGEIAGEMFREARPAATGVVCGLVDPRMLVEIEVTARRR